MSAAPISSSARGTDDPIEVAGGFPRHLTQELLEEKERRGERRRWLAPWFFGAAYALSVELMNIDPGIFTQKIKDFVDVRDVFNSAFKAGTFGLAIGLVGCYKGFYASGGAKGVGEATTSSVVTSSISVLVLDYILTVFMYSNA